MVLELAVQSIQNKLRLKSGTMLGNYEFYYAAGIICGRLRLTPEESLNPAKLHEYLVSQTEGKKFDDPVVAHLAKMIRYYKVEGNYDEQMGHLFQKGQSGLGDFVKKE